MAKPRVCVLRTAGTNCDKETAFAFEQAGAAAEFVHIDRLFEGERSLGDYQILAIPGGFSYGDDIAAGRILGNELRFKLGDAVRSFIDKGGLVIGICNGFQVLVKSGMLPGDGSLRQEASLILNDSAKFEARWVYLTSKVEGQRSKESVCVWTKNLPDTIYLPVAHGEGKFVTSEPAAIDRLKENGQVVFRYSDPSGRQTAAYPGNPNGSTDNIAGICDPTGRVLGLMPHPERHAGACQHPRWTSEGGTGKADGMDIFRNGVNFFKK